MVELKSLAFVLGELEPFFCSLALFDVNQKTRISENFYFNFNSDSINHFLGSNLVCFVYIVYIVYIAYIMYIVYRVYRVHRVRVYRVYRVHSVSVYRVYRSSVRSLLVAMQLRAHISADCSSFGYLHDCAGGYSS